MSGHSKWSNIKRRKEASDSVKGAIFTKMAKELAIAVRQGGADPESNSRLKDAIAKAKSNNMPNDNISRAIKKASGSNDGDDYEEIVYEGYGPAGVAIMVRALTNNRNRTAGDVRHIYDKYGGNMGVSGSVAFMFQQQGSIIIDSDSFDDEEQVMMDALEAGAQDFITMRSLPHMMIIITLRTRLKRRDILLRIQPTARPRLTLLQWRMSRRLSSLSVFWRRWKKMTIFRMSITTGTTDLSW